MDRLSYGPYLYALSPDVLAVLTMHGKSVIPQCLLPFKDSQCIGPLFTFNAYVHGAGPCSSPHTWLM